MKGGTGSEGERTTGPARPPRGAGLVRDPDVASCGVSDMLLPPRVSCAVRRMRSTGLARSAASRRRRRPHLSSHHSFHEPPRRRATTRPAGPAPTRRTPRPPRRPGRSGQGPAEHGVPAPALDGGRPGARRTSGTRSRRGGRTTPPADDGARSGCSPSTPRHRGPDGAHVRGARHDGAERAARRGVDAPPAPDPLIGPDPRTH